MRIRHVAPNPVNLRVPRQTLSVPLPVTMPGATERHESGLSVITIAEPNTLTQLVGWLKFRSQSRMVLMRGETEMHPSMRASGFRGVQEPGRQRISAELRSYIDELLGGPCACPSGPTSFSSSHHCTERVVSKTARGLVGGTYRAAIEPLVQHYGIRTRWLDVVDNIWVALWFACHRQVSVGRHASHIRRSAAQEGDAANVYIAVLKTGPLEPARNLPGYWVGPETRVVDLRHSVPSVYLRPHAQHGLLVAPASLRNSDGGELTGQVIAYLEIRLIDALEWLGHGAMTSPFVLFPPATRDEGYRRLIEHAPKPPALLGQVTIYGPSA